MGPRVFLLLRSRHNRVRKQVEVSSAPRQQVVKRPRFHLQSGSCRRARPGTRDAPAVHLGMGWVKIGNSRGG